MQKFPVRSPVKKSSILQFPENQQKFTVIIMSQKRNSCDLSLKLKVVEFSKRSSNCAAEREFGVTEKMVRGWRMKEEKLRNAFPKPLKKMRPVLAPYEDMESKLKEWALDLWGNVSSSTDHPSESERCILPRSWAC